MNRLVMKTCFTAVAVLSLVLTTTAGAAITDGLVSYWPLNGDLNDVVGGNDGTLMGTDATASFDAGQFGQGIDLDGVDQFVEIPNASDYDFVGQDFTISAWFRVDAFTKNWQALIAKGEGNRWRIHRRGGEGILTFNGGNADVPAYDPAALGLDPLDDGQMHHIAGVSDNTNGEVRMYIDGVLAATGPAPMVENNDMPVMIGENPDARNRTWDGLVDDVAIWGRALSADEVTFLQTNAVPEPSTAIMALLGMLGISSLRRRRTS